MRTLLFALAAWLLAAQSAAAQVDTSGVDQFWRTADRIAAGETLTGSDWDVFFTHPGYRFTQEAAQRRPVIEFCMRAVFTPGVDVAAALQNRSNRERRAELYADTCAHMSAAREQRAEIAVFLNSGAIEAASAAGLEEAARWLPADAMQRGAPPRIYVLLFEPQGFGRPGELVVDALYAMQKPAGQNAQFIGHEFHHAYRETYQRLAWADGAQSLIEQLDRFVHEGSASMVDKAAYYRSGTIPFGESETFLDDIRGTPQRLAQIDAVLAALSPTSESYSAAADTVDELSPGGGHLNGVFMAMTIEEGLGRETLIRSLSGPVAFFDAYQRAAQARRQFVFSDAAMANLRRAAGVQLR